MPYEIEKRDLSTLTKDGAKLDGSLVYKSKNSKWSSKLKLTVGSEKAFALKYNVTEGKSDFIVEKTYDGKKTSVNADTYKITGGDGYAKASDRNTEF